MITKIDAVRNALSKLNDEEREIIDRLYFNEETLRSVANAKKYLTSSSYQEKKQNIGKTTGISKRI